MNHYDRVKNAFSRMIGGAFIPKTEQADIDRLKAEGYQIIDCGAVVKVLNQNALPKEQNQYK